MKNNRRNNRKRRAGDDLDRMSEAAELYYEKGYKQARIGNVLKCSTMEVSRLLKEAREHKIVEIKLNYQYGAAIRKTLMDRYGLTEVRISTVFPNAEETRESLAEEAVEYFNELMAGGQAALNTTVGISGGRTIHKMVDLIEPRSRQIKIYPLTGIWRDLQINYVDSGALVHSLWLKCKDSAEAFWFPIEPLTGRTTKSHVLKQRKKYLENRQIKMVYQAANNVDIALIGVGPLREKSSTIRQLKNIGITYDYLKKKGAVGIAGGVWYDMHAQPVVEDYFLSVPLTTFRRLAARPDKRVVVVAGGVEKVEAIRVLLEHQMCNVLITDSRTASLLTQ